MHRFMTGLDEEYGWSRALKRQQQLQRPHHHA
jgi:hypothetical protein